MLRNFREVGGASNVLAISKEAGIPLAQSQGNLTPFQRMVLTEELSDQQEDAQSGSSPGAGQVNPQRRPGGGGRGDTITYTNDGEAD